MGRLMAIDYGQKRVGIAVTDELQLIANPLKTIHVKDIFSFLDQYLKDNQVDAIVVGEPKTMANLPSDASRFIEPFVKKLRKTLPDMKIERFDERFTSAMAKQTLIDMGVKKKQRQQKERLDEMSAALILKSYMEYKTTMNSRL